MFSKLRIDDIDQLYAFSADGWDFEYLQLSRGKLGFESQVVVLPGVQIEWNYYGQRILHRDCVKLDALVFSIVTAAEKSPTFLGNPLEPNVGLVFQYGRENEYVLFPGTHSLTVTVARDSVVAFNQELSREPLKRIPATVCENLVRSLDQVRTAAQSIGESKDMALQLTLRDRVLNALGLAIAFWSTDGSSNAVDCQPSRSFQIARAAADQMSLTPLDENPDMADLAEALDVSERTLYQSFRCCYGVGPYESHLIRRLHLFRRRLIMDSPVHGRVTQAALSLGFTHFGRLSEHYRRHFGETPRQTIKRRADYPVRCQ